MSYTPVPQSSTGAVAPVQYRQEVGTGRLVASNTASVPGAYVPGSAHRAPALHVTSALANEAMQEQAQERRAAAMKPPAHIPTRVATPIPPAVMVPATHKAAAVVGSTFVPHQGHPVAQPAVQMRGQVGQHPQVPPPIGKIPTTVPLQQPGERAKLGNRSKP